MIIRQAEHADIPELSALAIATYSDAFGYSFSASDLAAHLDKQLSPVAFSRILEEDIVLVAEEDSHIVGFVQFGTASIFADVVSCNDEELRRLYVRSNFQNRGTGTLLMEAALEHPRLKNAKCIFLDVWEHNHGAQRFYKRYGFEVIGNRRFQVVSGAETSLDLIMVRRKAKNAGCDAP